MNDDKLSSTSTMYDKLEGRILDFNLKMAGLMATLLVRPLALATDVFFRRDFGERYFTPNSALVSTLLWGLAANMGWLYDSGSNVVAGWVYGAGFQKLGHWIYHHNYTHRIGTGILVIQGILCVWNYMKIRARVASGNPWYSMSRGGSVFGTENQFRDIALAVVITVILGVFAENIAVLFIVSRIISYQIEARQQALFYNQYLDAVDAKIQAENLQRALDKGEPPSFTGGLFCPLPNAIKGEHRKRVARVVAGGAFAPGAPGEAVKRPDIQPEYATSKTTDSQPPATPPLREGLIALSQFFRSRNVIHFGLFGLICAACIYGAVSQQNPPAAMATQTAPQPPPVVSTPPPQPPPQVAPQAVAQVPKEPEHSQPAAKIATNAPVVTADVAAQAQAALQAKLRGEQDKEQAAAKEKEELALQKLKERRNQLIGQITNTLEAQILQLGEFKTNCLNRLNDNTNKIAKLSRSFRKSLTERNAKEQKLLDLVVNNQDDVLLKYLRASEDASSDQHEDPQVLNDHLQSDIAKMNIIREKMVATLDHFDVEISNAPAKGGFLFAR